MQGSSYPTAAIDLSGEFSLETKNRPILYQPSNTTYTTPHSNVTDNLYGTVILPQILQWCT